MRGRARDRTRLIGQLRACEISALAFCRLLERWARGDAQPPTPGERQAALRRAAERVETALTGLEDPLRRYLLELEAEVLEGRSWYGGPGAAELLDWEPVLNRAGVTRRPRASRRHTSSSPCSSARSKASRATARSTATPDPALALGRVLPLRENLLVGALDDLRVLSVI